MLWLVSFKQHCHGHTPKPCLALTMLAIVLFKPVAHHRCRHVLMQAETHKGHRKVVWSRVQLQNQNASENIVFASWFHHEGSIVHCTQTNTHTHSTHTHLLVLKSTSHNISMYSHFTKVRVLMVKERCEFTTSVRRVCVHTVCLRLQTPTLWESIANTLISLLMAHLITVILTDDPNQHMCINFK